MTDRWKYGRLPYERGQHFVMPRATGNGALVYGVWVVRARSRSGDGEAELLAEFSSKRFANDWSRARNATTTGGTRA